MEKEFDKWNELAKKVQQRQPPSFFRERDIWWCSIGVNIGSEENGKNEYFERPVLILKVFNHEAIRIAPLTSKIKNSFHHFVITHNLNKSSVILSQIKTLSTRRLTRKIGVLNGKQFGLLLESFRNSIGDDLKNEISVFSGDFSEPEGSCGPILLG